MKMRLILYFSLITLGTLAFAQHRTITGRILDAESKQPIKNANILVPDTQLGAFSNRYGFFQITIDSNLHQALRISHVGYRAAEIPIPVANQFLFYMEKETTNLHFNLETYGNPFPKPKSTDPPQDFYFIAESPAIPADGLDSIGSYLAREMDKTNLPIDSRGFRVGFAIDENGVPTDIQPPHEIDSTSAQLINELFAQMPPWKPATQRGEPVKESFNAWIYRSEQPESPKEFFPFYKYMADNINYPLPARKSRTVGDVQIYFELDEHGIANPKLIKDIGEGCGNEVMNVLSQMPQEVAHSLSNSYSDRFIIGVTFSLESNPPTKKETTPSSYSDVVMLDNIVVVGYGAAGTSQFSELISKVTPETPTTVRKVNLYTERMSFTGKRLPSLPEEVLDMKNLLFLDLDENNIDSLPDAIGNLDQLLELYVYDNQLTELPEGIRKLKKLKVLGLSSNQFTTFPEEILSFEKLESLDLSGNELTTLPEEIGQLEHLKNLYIHENHLTQLPESIFSLKKIQSIYLQGNPLDPGQVERLRSTFKKAKITF